MAVVALEARGEIDMAKLTVTTDGWVDRAGALRASVAPIEDAWLAAEPGDVLELQPGTYRRLTIRPSSRSPGSPPVTIEGGGVAVIGTAPVVGGSDTIYLQGGVRDLVLSGLVMEGASRAILKTQQPGGARKVVVQRCVMRGGQDTVWGDHGYFTGGYTYFGNEIHGIPKEHARYLHTRQGNHYFGGNDIRACGLTAYQEVARIHENGTPQPPARGVVTIEDETVIDVCLDGGSAYSFRGGCPGGDIFMNRVRVYLGSDPNAPASYRGKAAGAILIDQGTESQPGKGDGAHPGKYRLAQLRDVEVEIGTVSAPEGSARRPSLTIGNVETAVIESGRIVSVGGIEALDVKRTVDRFLIGRGVHVEGPVKYHGERWGNVDLFRTAHPECVA